MGYLNNNILTIKGINSHAFICNGPTSAGWYATNLLRYADSMNLLNEFRKGDETAIKKVCKEFHNNWSAIVKMVPRSEAMNTKNIFTYAVLDLDMGKVNTFWGHSNLPILSSDIPFDCF